MRIFYVVCLGISLIFPSIALADEQLSPIAEQGDWVAFTHSDSITDSPDECLASQLTAGFVVIVDNTGDIQVRVVNKRWSLPANVTGSVKLSVNGHSYSFDITGNTSNRVDADITQDQLTALIKDMEIAGSMTMNTGSDAPVTVSLSGSASVLTAFLTCAGIQNPTSNTGGNNPFSSSK